MNTHPRSIKNIPPAAYGVPSKDIPTDISRTPTPIIKRYPDMSKRKINISRSISPAVAVTSLSEIIPVAIKGNAKQITGIIFRADI